MARIIVLCDREHRLEPELLDLMRACGVELTYMDDRPHVHFDGVRWGWVQAWLEANVEALDRVFCCDAFDVFFQADPFRTLVTPGKMTFIGEGVIPAQNTFGGEVNRRWLTDCYGEKANAAIFNEVLCCGTVAGDAQVFLRWVRFFFASRPWGMDCPLDQPKLNVLAWTGAFAEADISFEVQSCNGTVMTPWDCRPREIPFGEYFEASFDGKRVSSVVHQWKRLATWREMYPRRCPRLPELGDE